MAITEEDRIYERELLRAIPVVDGMDIGLVDLSLIDLTLSAPLNTHINYEGTAFGGSLNTLCVLSCYLLVHHRLKKEGLEFNSLVIQDSRISYLSPVHSDFKARSQFENVDSFLKLFKRKGISRAEMRAVVTCEESKSPLVQFEGRFVATRDLNRQAPPI
ncbi:MAG: thioesterase domain-containing protein [Bacteriovoracaceae bacterium]|nr:thioesterase domain-containing protein [Bacteriovoracaceae bacterium]